MSATDRKIEHELVEDNGSSGNGSGLQRQVTVSMSPDQYERLFFSPTGPTRGELTKTFGKISPQSPLSLLKQTTDMQ